MTTLHEYKARIPNLTQLAKKPGQLTPYLAFFLEEYAGVPAVTGSALLKLFDDLRIKPPTLISDVIRRSRWFIRARKGGYKLSHDGTEHVRSSLLKEPVLPSSDGDPAGSEADYAAEGSHQMVSAQSRDVFVIYGRDEKARSDMFAFLRALNLHPMEFSEVVRHAGMPAPHTWDAIRIAFMKAQACVVLLSPDERVSLRDDLRDDEGDESGWQARPNVYIEAGMALALQPNRTILVTVGKVREASDLAGMQYVRMNGSSANRNKLLNALRLAGCDAQNHGNDWLLAGQFDDPLGGKK